MCEYVQCPYFRREEKTRISCEGITDNNIINLMWPTKAEKMKYLKSVCCQDYTACKIYKLLEEKYDC